MILSASSGKNGEATGFASQNFHKLRDGWYEVPLYVDIIMGIKSRWQPDCHLHGWGIYWKKKSNKSFKGRTGTRASKYDLSYCVLFIMCLGVQCVWEGGKTKREKEGEGRGKKDQFVRIY